MNTSADQNTLRDLIRQKKALVCCGPGGVGKTTTAAAIGLAAAREGRKVLVLTIDPARRLAQAMGIDASSSNLSQVDAQRLKEIGINPPGELHAMMLNPGAVLDSMVKRFSSSPEGARRIFSSRLYGHLANMVAGMQEYAAAEALFELSSSNRYDLIVLDTPPSRNALEFLEAPGRLSKFLDERVLHFFLPGTARKWLVWKKAGEFVHGLFARVFGQEFFEEMQQFILAFSGMFGTFRIHAQGVRALLTSKDAAFLLVTCSEPGQKEEAVFLRHRLLAMKVQFAGFILNRSWAGDETALPNVLLNSTSWLEKLEVLAQEELRHIKRDKEYLDQLRKETVPNGIIIAAPYLGMDVEDLKGLQLLVEGIFAKC